MSKFFFTIRSRLMLIVLLTALPGILLLWLTGLEQRRQAVQTTQDEIVSLTMVATNMQSELIYNVQSFLQTLAHLPTIRTEDMTGCQEILSHLVGEHFNYYSSFYVADLKGNILCSPPGMHTPPDFDLCDHYQNLIHATDFVFSGYHICRHTGKAVFSIGYPIYNFQDERVLVSNASLDLVWFYDFAKEIKLPEGSELIVLTRMAPSFHIIRTMTHGVDHRCQTHPQHLNFFNKNPERKLAPTLTVRNYCSQSAQWRSPHKPFTLSWVFQPRLLFLPPIRHCNAI